MRTPINIGFLSLLLFIQSASAQWLDVSPNIWHTISPASFPDDNTGYISSGAFPCMYKTTNGGASWDSIGLPYLIQDIDFLYPDQGYILFNDSSQFYLGWTINSGTTWSMNPMPAGVDFNLIQFVNPTTGYASAPGFIYKTTDSGANWIAINIGSYGATDKEFVGFDTIIFTGLKMDASGSGAVIRSTDGGNSFQTDTIGTVNSHFRGSHFVNGTTGLAVYENFPFNYLVKTTDGGSSWDTLITDSSWTLIFNDVYMINSNESYIALGDGSGAQGFIYHVTGSSFVNDLSTIPMNLHRFYRGGNTLYVVGQQFAFKLSTPVGIEEQVESLSGIYPNPTSDNIFIPIKEKSEVSLVDMNGKIILTQQILPGEKLSLRSVSNGTYSIYIKNKSGIYISKIIVNK